MTDGAQGEGFFSPCDWSFQVKDCMASVFQLNVSWHSVRSCTQATSPCLNFSPNACKGPVHGLLALPCVMCKEAWALLVKMNERAVLPISTFFRMKHQDLALQ